MKKSNYLGIFASILALVANTSCEKDINSDDTGGKGSQTSSIYVVYNGFTGYEGSDLSFTDGDKIGVFTVNAMSNAPGISNLCLTAVRQEDGTLIWKSDTEDIEVSDDFRYFAYYPYDESVSGGISNEATDRQEFFKGLTDGFSVPADQSSVDKLRSAMLMTASGEVHDGSLTFQMQHAMSMICFNLPVTIYRFSNTDRKLSDYINSIPVTFNGTSPLYNGREEAVMLFNPQHPEKISGTCISDSGEEVAWETTPEGTAGATYRHVIGNGNRTIDHLLQAGDFFLSDGNLLSRDTDKSIVSARKVIGLVFQINPDRIGQTEKDALGGDVHGLVVAVRNAGGTFRRWYMDRATENFDRDETEIGLPDILVPGDPLATFKMADADISGYSNSLLIKNKRSEDYQMNNYPSIKAALEFADEIGAPQSGVDASGWFLPSNGQWFDILRGLCGVTIDEFTNFSTIGDDFYWTGCGHIPDLLNAAQEKIADGQKDVFNIGDCYWTSSAANSRYAREIDISDNYMDSMIEFKTNGALVRPVLVF